MEINELIQKLRESLPEPMDYAEMVGAPAWAYGCMYAYDDPLYFYVEEAIEKLSEMPWANNTAVSLLVFDENGVRAEFVNDHSHVPPEYMPKRNRIAASLANASEGE
jgi:hypothetical protein